MKKLALALFTTLMVNSSFAGGKLTAGKFNTPQDFVTNSALLSGKIDANKYYMLSPIQNGKVGSEIFKQYTSKQSGNKVTKKYNNYYSSKLLKLLNNLDKIVNQETDVDFKAVMEASKISKTQYNTEKYYPYYTEQRGEHISIYINNNVAENNHKDDIVSNIHNLFETKKIKVRGFEVANGGVSKKVLVTFSIMIGGGNGAKEIYQDIDASFHMAIFECNDQYEAQNLATYLLAPKYLNPTKPTQVTYYTNQLSSGINN